MFNISTAFIDFFAWLGWATELKTVPESIVKQRIERTGDGSHKHSKEVKKLLEVNNDANYQEKQELSSENFWGFGKFVIEIKYKIVTAVLSSTR